jgi:hypothetical protein
MTNTGSRRAPLRRGRFSPSPTGNSRACYWQGTQRGRCYRAGWRWSEAGHGAGGGRWSEASHAAGAWRSATRVPDPLPCTRASKVRVRDAQ